MLAVEAKQFGAGRPYETYLVRGLDSSFLEHSTFGFGQMARGYDSAQEVWEAVRTTPGLAVVDATIVPRRDSFGFEAAPDFALSGFLYQEGTLDPIPVRVLDKQTGRTRTLTVIAILKESAPVEMVGITTSQKTLSAAFPGRTQPTIHYFGLAPGVDAEDTAAKLESAFLQNGLDAQSIQEVVDDTVAANMTFNRLIQGFLGLGLLVGVAALGVISARAVVERRQQIGVMRAIGFRREMVQAAFILESSFVALTAIVVGTALGLLLAWNIIDDTRRQPSWAGMSLYVPWVNLLHHLRRRVRRRPARDARSRDPRLADQAGRGAPLPVAVRDGEGRRWGRAWPRATLAHGQGSGADRRFRASLQARDFPASAQSMPSRSRSVRPRSRSGRSSASRSSRRSTSRCA